MLLAMLLMGCNSKGIEVAIPFTSTAGGEAFGCADPAMDFGTPPTSATAQYLDVFVSDLVLVKAGTEFPVTLTPDGQYQTDRVALIDLGDATGSCLDSAGTHDTATGTVSRGAVGWDELRFSVGVPDDLDHLDAATAEPPLDDPELWWSWTLGYKFMRWELATSTGEWQFHLGSEECTGSDAAGYHCNLPNRPAIALGDFADGDTVAIDAAALAAGSDLTHGGCLSSDVEACGPPLTALGLPFEGSNPPLQTVFTRE
jgi:uncharacterized repeat protein (TIGR04052 family)